MSDTIQANDHGLVQITPKMVRDNPLFYLSTGNEIIIEAKTQNGISYTKCWFEGVQVCDSKGFTQIGSNNTMELARIESDLTTIYSALFEDGSVQTFCLCDDTDWYSQCTYNLHEMSETKFELAKLGGWIEEGRDEEKVYFQKTFIVWGQPLPTAPF